MLSEKTIEIVKSTVPVLEQHGTAITSHFYKTMFANHPELLNVFNHANQKQGRQQRALANAVLAAAKSIDHLEAILPAVKQIGHKHRSLGILPEQYPIVGKNLLIAIKEVLGEAATDEIMKAWEEAYEVIADAFIAVEAEMYREAEQQEGGWAGFRAFKVERKVKESDVITSFYLVPEDGNALARFAPGQYVSVKMDIPGETYTHIRQYSLSDAPGKPYYRISVKREDAAQDRPAGIVSVYLHEHVQEGSTLVLSAPAGDFVLDQEDQRPVVLISGGVGVTPLMSMFNTLVESAPERKVTFIQAVQNSNVHAFKEYTEDVARKNRQVSVHWCYSDPTEEDRAAKAYHKEGLVDLDWLKSIVPDPNASFYFCGPTPFMQAVHSALTEWGIPEEDIHFEFFGPKGTLVPSSQTAAV